MAKGYLALVLHAHLPFVRHPESETFLEERWLFEALTDTYLPLLQVYQGLIRDQVDFRITMSFTPTLLSMLTDPLLQKRFIKHLDNLIGLAEKEKIRTQDQPEFYRLACDYFERFSSLRELYLRYDGHVVNGFRELQKGGRLEIITSAATHAFLPAVMTEEAMYAQIKTGVDLHTKTFGVPPRGIWLPECGYTPGLDLILQKCGIQFFFTDTHGIGLAESKPVFGTLSPVLTPHHVAAFARDPESSKQVWSSVGGYPGDFDYREYYRDIGFDLDYETIKPHIHPDGIRIHTGFKYYRVTGPTSDKQPYNPDWAREKAAQHAGHFLYNRERQIEHWTYHMGRDPIVVATYDAELFGHWWYEGPLWIDMLLRKMHFDQDTIKTICPSEYLQLYNDFQICRLPIASWGRGGYADVWLREENDWIYPALHRMENCMVEMANRFHEPEPLEQRALNQAARELMLAQSSDWAFIMDNKTMVEYAVKRTKYHVNRFERLYQMLKSNRIDEKWLQSLEQVDNLFPDLDYRVYRSVYEIVRYSERSHKPCVLMLSWEFPPMTVGGLSRHVYDLSRYLVRQGIEVHVVTTEIGQYPAYEVIEGVHVHRVHVLKPDGGEFIHWAFQLNLMMIDACQSLIDSGLSFDLIHAHDWLVCYAATTLKQQYELPLVATIHATEHGRNHGIHTDLQRTIHGLESRLTYEAERVILCSSYMQREVESVFQLPAHKLDVIPNGVDPDQLQFVHAHTEGLTRYALEDEQIVLFIGRLVREKGVHLLLEAAPAILTECPSAKFVIAGKGPAQEELQQLAHYFGLGEKVVFTGFISDEERNLLLHTAKVTVFPSLYEPFGIVALEAMAANTPVVVADVGGLGDVISHGRNGLKMIPNDVASLALQVKSLLHHPEWAASLAATARAEIGKYSWHEIASQTLAVYKKILKDSNDRTEPKQREALQQTW